MRVFIRVKNRNLSNNKIALKKSYLQAYYNGDIESLAVFTEDNEFIEEYYGKGLDRLMDSAARFGEEDFWLAHRHLTDEV